MDDRQRIQAAVDARAKARELLAALLESKSAMESQGALARGDLYKRVTGQSSLENAIAATRRAIESYDRLIAQMERDSSQPEELSVARAQP
jgi:hypothetical protein